MVKRKYGDRRDWARVLASRYAIMPLRKMRLPGVTMLYSIDAVRAPLWVTCAGRRVCVADAGYTWLQYYPKLVANNLAGPGVAQQKHRAGYTATAMFDATGTIVQWYFDICAATGRGAWGIPWHDDLYLDIVLDPDTGAQEVIDADELDEALEAGRIDEALYHAAWRETHRLAPLVAQGALPAMSQAAPQRAILLERLARLERRLTE